MKINSFNICPTCAHITSCVLTDQKSQVWSCSEYEETSSEIEKEPEQIPEMEFELVTQ
ncbi:hypothetical protein INR76_08135 [Marixanthomonas sp. SCSIO 43207]|uniref:hypothetical protein n=1 Tax=Marixanthomonas sp. SCSIO 43207 TaxID=2779360 RepID=UPI001CA963A1|nr:hypothetical protein [Marixanthomonas sp. SCSIO 43207]UAB80103.1 hypothetical protein INR76_08135 [Marixanthomonas sp. SCSIO 43207]